MGRLFTGSSILNPEKTLATFDNGTVCSDKISFAPGGSTLMYYESFREGARIYRSMTSGLPDQLAWCDKFGRIDANGERLGCCESGEVRNSSGRTIAYYEGDAYGAAAAACAVLFSLGDADTADRSDNRDDRSAEEAVPSGGENDGSFLTVLLAGIGMALLGMAKLLWKLIRTLPFWGPYVFIAMLPLVMLAVMMPGAAAAAAVPVLGMLEGCALLLYPILHTVLLVRCRKRQEKGRYRPVYVAFFILILSLLILPCIPAVAYQIVWIVRDQKKRNGGGVIGNEQTFCPECGHAAAPGECFCKECGAKLHEQ